VEFSKDEALLVDELPFSAFAAGKLDFVIDFMGYS
jgi:hypothetical protein